MGIAIANRKNRCDFGALSSEEQCPHLAAIEKLQAPATVSLCLLSRKLTLVDIFEFAWGVGKSEKWRGFLVIFFAVSVYQETEHEKSSKKSGKIRSIFRSKIRAGYSKHWGTLLLHFAQRSQCFLRIFCWVEKRRCVRWEFCACVCVCVRKTQPSSRINKEKVTRYRRLPPQSRNPLAATCPEMHQPSNQEMLLSN